MSNAGSLPGILDSHARSDNASEYIRLSGRVKIESNTGCWVWIGAKQSNGYGRCWYMKQNTYTHRAFYSIFYGEILDGMDIDHLCRNRLCVNPLHLEQVTRSVNLRRGNVGDNIAHIQRQKTHCPQGHAYSPENTRVTSEGKRVCRACARDRYWARKGNKNV